MEEKINEYEGLTWKEAYEKAVGEVESGEPFSCDLVRHNLWVGGVQVVRDGEFCGNGDSAPDGGNPLEEIERLYSSYKRSIPSERSERRRYRGTQFRALDFSELDDDDIMYGDRREEARAKLEIFVLFSILSGALKWNDGWGSWFWRSEKDRDLVLLKQWFKEET